MKKLFALLLAAAMVLSMVGCNSDPTPAGTTAPGETTASGNNTATTDSTKGDSTDTTEGSSSLDLTKLYDRESYSGDDKAAVAAVDTVVATMGDAKLTNGMLQVYYWLDVYAFVNNYGSYLDFIGIDYTAPLDEQDCPEGDGSWQHYFLEAALNSWQNYQALALMAEAENVPMDAELQKDLDNLEQILADSAKENKYESVEALLQADAGPGVTFEAYKQYMTVYHRGYSYFNTKYDAIDVTDADIEKYYTEHEKELKGQKITKDSGNVHDVRHILIEITGDSKDENGKPIYTDADWAACEAKAQKLLDEWKNGEATEASFAFLAADHTADTGSAENGGLYTDLNEETNFVQEFKDWYLAEGRAQGDTGLVKSEYGYHIMYYSMGEPQWIRTCRNAILDEMTTKIVKDAVAQYPVDVNFNAIILGTPDLKNK